MAKRKGQLSVKKRREEMRQRQQARQNLIIKVVGGLLMAIVLVFIVWQVTPLFNSEDESMTATGERPLAAGERPLAAIEPAARNGYYNAYPEMVIDADKTYQAVVKTSQGDMRFRLFNEEAPLTVNNFVFLARQGFYDGLTFHRVISNFMAQGGDPSGIGTGGPGYRFQDETDNDLAFDRRGLLAMANAGPGTNGSQFFITFVPTPHLNGRHTIFGQLVEGDDVLSAITVRDPNSSTPADVIERIDIVEQ